MKQRSTVSEASGGGLEISARQGWLWLFLWSAVSIGSIGCQSFDGVIRRTTTDGDSNVNAPVHIAIVESSAPTLHRIDSEAWDSAEAFPLMIAGAEQSTAQPREPGEVRLAWHDGSVYILARLTDHDVVQLEEGDQQNLYLTGDVFEVFIQPVESRSYWELHVAPGGDRSAYFYPSPGRRRLPGHQTDEALFHEVSTSIDGSLNDWSDTDTGWRAVIAVPLGAMTGGSTAAAPPREFRMLLARYNYGYHLDDREVSSFPHQPIADFHRPEHWARVKLLSQKTAGPTR